MSVLTNFTTSTSAADAMDTINKLLSDMRDLQSTVLRPFIIGVMGDSNAYRYTDEFSGTQNDKVLRSTDGTTYSKLTTGRVAMDLGNKIVAATGRPVQYLSGGVSGTTAQQWETQGGPRDNFVTALKNAKRCDLVIMPLGFNDVNMGYSLTYSGQLALLRRVIANIRSASGIPDLKFLIVTSQDIANNLDTLAYERMAEMTIALGDIGCYFGFNTYDLPLQDNIHLTDAGSVTAAARAYPQVMSVLTGSAQVRGPRITGVAAVSATQTRVTIAHGAGSDFTPTSGITGFVIAQGATKLAISAAVRETATSILLTHATTGGTSASIYYSPAGVGSDNATVIHDNGALALPLELSAAPIEIVPVGGTVTPTPTPSTTYGPQDTTNTDRFDTGAARHVVRIVLNGSGGVTADVGTDAAGTLGYRVTGIGETYWLVSKFKADGSTERLTGGDNNINTSTMSFYNSSTSKAKAGTVVELTTNADGLLVVSADGTVILTVNAVSTGYPGTARGTYGLVRSTGGAVNVKISPINN